MVCLDPQNALAYNTRGNAYSDLGEHRRAIKDFDEAIRLDSKASPPYGGRALSNTYLQRDSEAKRDGERAIELGFDRGILGAAIEEAKRDR